ncbi:hypothetical protein HK096_008730 [Nowakowskiella sp. JEL0078]|nr:hypothetical protein HK096_008730 [Nowakowskiella sp. JEL0078]
MSQKENRSGKISSNSDPQAAAVRLFQQHKQQDDVRKGQSGEPRYYQGHSQNLMTNEQSYGNDSYYRDGKSGGSLPRSRSNYNNQDANYSQYRQDQYTPDNRTTIDRSISAYQSQNQHRALQQKNDDYLRNEPQYASQNPIAYGATLAPISGNNRQGEQRFYSTESRSTESLTYGNESNPPPQYNSQYQQGHVMDAPRHSNSNGSPAYSPSQPHIQTPPQQRAPLPAVNQPRGGQSGSLGVAPQQQIPPRGGQGGSLGVPTQQQIKYTKSGKPLDVSLKDQLATEDRLKGMIKQYEQQTPTLLMQKKRLNEFRQKLKQLADRKEKSEYHYNIFEEIDGVVHKRELLEKRQKQIIQLAHMDNLQQAAIVHMRKRIDEEKNYVRLAMHEVSEVRDNLEKLTIEEERWFLDMASFGERKRDLEEKEKGSSLSKAELKERKEMSDQLRLKNSKLEMKFKKKKNFVQKDILEKFGPDSMKILGLMVATLGKLKKEAAEVNRQLKKEHQAQLIEQQLTEAEDIELDKSKPDWENSLYPWPVTCEMTIHKWLPKNVSVDDVCKATSLASLGIDKETFKEIIKMKAMPFSKGSYRIAKYGYSASRIKYTIKEFKFNLGLEVNFEFAEKQCMYHTFCEISASNFSKDLEKANIMYSVSFINSFVGTAATGPSSEQMVYMLEPLLKKFAKWTNNYDYIHEIDGQLSNEGDMMASFTHYTYEKSHRQFLITDLQGCVELVGRDAVNDSDSRRSLVVPTNASRYAMRVDDATVGGEGPFRDRYKFTLTDPAIHFLVNAGENGLYDEILSDEAGNMSHEGKEKFFSKHVCRDICRTLGLPNYE